MGLEEITDGKGLLHQAKTLATVTVDGDEVWRGGKYGDDFDWLVPKLRDFAAWVYSEPPFEPYPEQPPAPEGVFDTTRLELTVVFYEDGDAVSGVMIGTRRHEKPWVVNTLMGLAGQLELGVT